MMKLKQLQLVNFGGYENNTFIFNTNQNNPDVPASVRLSQALDKILSSPTNLGSTIVPISLFFGPNGIGKSTILEAIRFLSNPLVFKGRQQAPDVYLRPWIRDPEFVPLSDHVLEKKKADMLINAVFTDDVKDYGVTISNAGFIKNELPSRPDGSSSGGYAYYVDADNPLNWARFQLIDIHANRFIELAEAIYGYECDLDGDVKDELTDDYGNVIAQHTYYQNLIVTKGKEKIHFARMSAGEKKIATMIRMLCNPDNTDDKDIILIDNMEMHVYYKRHPKMIDKLREYFPNKQIIATTHSKSMIDYGNSVEYVKNFDLEIYRPEYRMLENQKPAESIVEKTEETPPPDGFVRQQINTPHGIMNVLVPVGSHKLEVDENGKTGIQNMIDGAVKIDIDEMGKVVSYEDPNASQFVAGSGQIKRLPEKLSPAQKRRLESGDKILTGPVVTESTQRSFDSFNETRPAASYDTLSAKKSIVSKHSCECRNGGTCKASPDVSIYKVERPDITNEDTALGAILKDIPEEDEKPDVVEQPKEQVKGFWAKLMNFFN